MITKLKDLLFGAGSVFFISGNYFPTQSINTDLSYYFRMTGKYINNSAIHYEKTTKESESSGYHSRTEH